MLQTDKNCNFIFYLYRKKKKRNANCLDKTTIHVDMILYLSLYYLVNDLVHLPNSHINKQLNKERRSLCGKSRQSNNIQLANQNYNSEGQPSIHANGAMCNIPIFRWFYFCV